MLIPKTLISKALSTTATASAYTNTDGYRTIVTSIVLTAQSAGTTTRLVTIYKGGTSAGNERINIDLDSSGVQYPKTVTIDTPIILTGTEAIYAKQDAGTDVNIEVSGTEEQIL